MDSHVVTKGGAGFLAGMAGRHMAHITPAVLTVGLVVISSLVQRSLHALSL